MIDSFGPGTRTVAVGAALAAALALPMPWAAQQNSFGGQTWSGWALGGAARHDGHQPLPAVAVVLVVVLTAALFLLSWLAADSGAARWPAVSALAVAAVLTVASFPLLNAIQDANDAERPVTAQFGFVLWRLAVLLTLIALARAASGSPAGHPRSG